MPPTAPTAQSRPNKLPQRVDADQKHVAVNRRINAPPSTVFEILADPRRHRELDGSGMVRGLASGTVITGVDDSFTMKMYFHEIGDYEMINHIVEYEANQRISWEPEAGNGHPGANTANARWGHRWTYALTPEGARTTIVTETYDFSRVSEHNMGRIGDGRHSIEAMANSLERLDALCTQAGTAAQAEAPVGRVPEAPVQGNR